MKNAVLLPAVIILSLLNFSCKEDFSPKTDFKSGYVINCIINLDYRHLPISFLTHGTARITKFYNIQGYAPTYPANLFVPGVKVYIEYRGTQYKLYELYHPVTGALSYRDIYEQLPFYPSYTVYLNAEMPDGKVLTAETKLLNDTQIKYSYNFVRGFSTNINRFMWGDNLTVTWDKQENCLSFPRLVLQYYKYVNPAAEPDSMHPDGIYSYTMDIPLIFSKGKPIYPSYSYGNSVSFSYPLIDSLIRGISKGDTAKSNYKLYSMSFRLIKFDESLSKYYSSIHGSLDDYSIRHDESVYSNIKGGLGIFGSQLKLNDTWLVDPEYAHSFGYKSFKDPFPGETGYGN